MAGVDGSKRAQLMEMLKKELRSLLTAAKEGLTPAQLEQEYVAMIGKPLPLRDLGFQSTLELVANMPEVVRVCPYEKGTFILKAIADEATKGIAKLVARQKSAKARKNAVLKADAGSPSKNLQSFPWKGRAPVLPTTVKAELRDLLSSSPLLLLEFNQAFSRRFGRAFQYTKYGFSSMSEVLRSVSDIIAVEQTRAGSLLTLKKHLAREREKKEVPREKVWEKVSQATPAVGMPPLEPICETENLHLTAEEKTEPVETQVVDLGDRLKQPQDLEQSLQAKLIKTPEIPLDAVQDRNLCSLPQLEARCLVGVFVEFIVSPSQFYIHVCSRETSDKLQDMMIEMRHLYSNKLISDRYIMPESAVQPGQLCCVTVSKWWYRVIIHRVINDEEVEVFYADYGNLEIVRKSWLRFLKWCYLKLPAQAIPCSLAWVKPMEGTWSSAATLLFKKLCNSKLLVGIVDEYVNGILHLFLCDTSTKEDVYFHCVLRDEGYADVCGENVPSQGFMELNPSALYVQASGMQNAEPVEPDPGLQQESLDTDNETATSKLDGDELCDQQWHLSAKEETWDDVQPLLHEVSVPRTDQDPELAQEDTNEIPAELMAVVKTPHSLGESSVPAVLFKSVEDFHTSFIYSKQPAEMSQDDPDHIERFSNEIQLHEAVHPSVLLMAIPFMLDNRNSEEKVNKDLPGSLVAGPCGTSELPGQGPSQKVYVPPARLSALVAAARLATSSDYFQWLPSLKKV
ncbi:tudor domain-containing protein 5 isoform X1 [Patagioenas fasciata]|uniref:tudor domain-containing protein 5 isoform X1 n=1 Tax=Patagioenas fasciata TaxID=372321 RepID=UPI003A9946F6